MLWAGLLLTLNACARKAPGPDECRRFAYQVTGVSSARELELAPVKSQVDELTRQCLVTPFDRKLLRCVERGAPLRACSLEYELRRAGR